MINKNIIAETEKLISSIEIPSRPIILLKINEEVTKPEPDFKAIISLIYKDLAMTAKMIQIANSPFFGVRYKVNTVDRALSVLGLNNFNDIILASSLRKAFAEYQIPSKILDDFYQHYLLIAGVSKFLAKNTLSGKINSNLAYITGLFHDCGILLLTKKYSDYYEYLHQHKRHDQSMLNIEESRYKTNHCLIGSHMAKSWQLPDIVFKVIPHHHDADLSIHRDEDIRHILAILLLSEHLISKLPDYIRPNGIYNNHITSEELFERLLRELKLDKYDFECIEENIEEFVKLI